MTLFKNQFLTISSDKKLEALITVWEGKPALEDFAFCIDTILKILKEQKLHKILNDTRDLQPISLQAQQYVADTVACFVKHYPFKQAHLMAKDAFVRFSVTNFDHKVRQQGGDINEIFDDEAEACKWLANQRTPKSSLWPSI